MSTQRLNREFLKAVLEGTLPVRSGVPMGSEVDTMSLPTARYEFFKRALNGTLPQ